MLRNPNYLLQKLDDTYYLLPFGQAYANRESGLQINETGAFLWEQLAEDPSLQELCALYSAKYDVSDDEYDDLCGAVEQFLRSLAQRGLMATAAFPAVNTDMSTDTSSMTSTVSTNPSSDVPTFSSPITAPNVPTAPLYKTLSIAGITLKLYGSEDAFSEAFDLFATTNNTPANLTVEVSIAQPSMSQGGNVLLRHKQLTVIDCDTYYVLRFPELEALYEAHFSKDGSFVRFYCKDSLDEFFRQGLFHAIRLPFLYLAQRKNMVVIHSASILYKDKAWLFSAPSGTGKTTHVNLWKELLDTPIINGDLNLCTFTENADGTTKPASFVVHGIPWCGTSGICDNKTYPLGGIIFLKQADCCNVEKLTPSKKQLHLSNRFISPVWNEAQLKQNLKFAKALSEQVLICRLHCTPTKEAVTCIKREIDSVTQ